MTEELWFRFAVALSIGLIVGVERERSKGTGPERREAGVRTFAAATLLGALSMQVGGPLLLAMATCAVGALLTATYLRRRGDDPGLTTEISLLLCVLLGALALSQPLLAGGLGVALTIMLAIKEPMHAFVRDVLSKAELNDALILAAATVIVWPALPDQGIGPYGAINPFKLWTVVIIIIAIGGAGHVATRLLGGAYGLPVSGLASGFVSSSAAIAAMGEHAKADPGILRAAVAGASLSTVATFAQMGLLLAAVSPPTALALAPALVAGGAVAATWGVWFTLRALGGTPGDQAPAGRAFSLVAALLLAGLLAAMLVAAEFLREHLGQTGVIAGAAAAGFADTHAAAISVASLASSGALAPGDALLPILAAMTTNVLTKIVLAAASGPKPYGLRLIPGLVLSMAAAWAAALATA
jgi:uncharacterized membrane protein (DUF4010 family)